MIRQKPDHPIPEGDRSSRTGRRDGVRQARGSATQEGGADQTPTLWTTIAELTPAVPPAACASYLRHRGQGAGATAWSSPSHGSAASRWSAIQGAAAERAQPARRLHVVLVERAVRPAKAACLAGGSAWDVPFRHRTIGRCPASLDMARAPPGWTSMTKPLRLSTARGLANRARPPCAVLRDQAQHRGRGVWLVVAPSDMDLAGLQGHRLARAAPSAFSSRGPSAASGGQSIFAGALARRSGRAERLGDLQPLHRLPRQAQIMIPTATLPAASARAEFRAGPAAPASGQASRPRQKCVSSSTPDWIPMRREPQAEWDGVGLTMKMVGSACQSSRAAREDVRRPMALRCRHFARATLRSRHAQGTDEATLSLA
jgi:hypothetical protein